MNPNVVVLIAFLEFDNLGVGYLASVLKKNGFEPIIIDFRESKEKILEIIHKNNSLIVGFSIIFQYYILEFRDLINYLRLAGVESHFCAGGQYGSMRYNELLDLIPSLDSVVRFDGEEAFLELVISIYSGSGWESIKNLVFKKDGKVVVNPLRIPEMDLDKFPYPTRLPLKEYALGEKFATIIASRGCLNNCSFCNNTEYLRLSPVHTKRVRLPEKVAGEICSLHKDLKCSVFLFEDDDFPLGKYNSHNWLNEFCNELSVNNIEKKILWKINCRPDEIESDTFALMKNHGLFLVFLGIDDGTDSGLARLNKHMTVEECQKGIQILKKLEIDFDYGYMMFQPSSNFSSVNENLNFLRQLCSDGYTPAIFLRMMPFFGTRVEKELEAEGRLKGEPGSRYYDFLDASLEKCYDAIKDCFGYWLYNSAGLVNVLRWSRSYIAVYSRFYITTSEIRSIASEIRVVTAESNIYMFDYVKLLLDMFEASGDQTDKIEYSKYVNEIAQKHEYYRERLLKMVKRISHLAELQDIRRLIR